MVRAQSLWGPSSTPRVHWVADGRAPCGPFSRKQAEEAGLSWRDLSGPKFRRLFRNVYVPRGFGSGSGAACQCCTAATYVDLGRYLELIDLVVLGDSLVRADVTTPLELIEASRGATGRRARCNRSRWVAGLDEGGTDEVCRQSPVVSRPRLTMAESGWPTISSSLPS